MQAQECGKSECRPVMGRIGVSTLPYAKAGRLPHGDSLQETFRTF
ncbi:hypothetical protein M135_2012 [Bacteroides fragilis str. S36L5]|uniref:Uncharacterized protein n=1 Tax=Phocaeicola vulgatus PC510 TaxID=702446 RepID=D4V502_PHOVU|nr:hypothetical protein CUU_2394 [Phocaeicola vulgatus PC510]EYA91273.1 hypothetical protein M135_2012 [Bacteroides fragilis str. S36L5]